MGALKFCRQGQHAVIPLFVKGGIVRGDDIDFLDTSNLFYPNSQLNFPDYAGICGGGICL